MRKLLISAIMATSLLMALSTGAAATVIAPCCF
jgi:hypothetical protein